MYFIFAAYIPILLTIFWKMGICQGQIQTSLRFSKVLNCDMNGLKWLMENLTLHYRHPTTFFYARYNVIEDIKRINKLFVHIERCNEQGYDCEDFQNYRVDRFCQMLSIENLIWSEIVKRFHPPLRCPVEKAIYEVQNSKVDIDALMNWFPEMVKYRWKAVLKFTNEQDKVVFCNSVEVQLYQFRLQDRKPPRKPRPKT